MFTFIPHPVKLDSEYVTQAITVSERTGGPMVVTPLAFDFTQTAICAAVESTMMAEGRWHNEFTCLVIPPCGHVRCAGGKLAASLN